MKKYETYKESGIEWMGKIPEEWILTKIKYATAALKSGGTPQSGNLDFYIGNGTPWVSIGDMSNTDIVKTTTKTLSKAGLADKSLVVYPEGTLIYSIYASIGKVAILGIPAAINQALLAIDFKDGYLTRYYKYVLQAMEQFILKFANGNTQFNLNAEIVSNFVVPNPSIEEQQAIASYLDFKVGQIDASISAINAQIEDLKAYRQSIISEVVTKGFNPKAPKKDSGIEWIGNIPEGWDIKRLRFLGNTQNGISKSKEFFGEGFPFVSYSDVYKNEKLPTNPSGLVQSSDNERSVFSVCEGDVFFTRTSETAEEIGFSSVCEKTIENATYAGFLIRFRPYANILDKGFSKYYFRSSIHRSFFVNKMNVVTRASLSQDLLMNLPVVLPPLQEQHAIAEYLDRKTTEIDNCIAASEKCIEDLQKYRASLISEAVTGKIDVRDWTPKKEKIQYELER